MTGAQLTIEEAIANRDGILHLIAGDPRKSASVRAVAETIAAQCAVGDRVSANLIRPHLPTWINRQAIGAAFGALVKARALRPVRSSRRAALVKVGTEVSDDTQSGNSGRDIPLYRWAAAL